MTYFAKSKLGAPTQQGILNLRIWTDQKFDKIPSLRSQECTHLIGNLNFNPNMYATNEMEIQ